MPGAFCFGKEVFVAPDQICCQGRILPSGVLATVSVYARFSSLVAISTCSAPRVWNVELLFGRI